MISRILVYCFMVILLAAHFSRADQNVLAILILVAPSLLFIRQKWVIYVLQSIAYVGSVAWLYSAYRYIQIRISTGDDWTRLLIILGVVALYTFWSGYLLRSSQIEARYGLESDNPEEKH